MEPVVSDFAATGRTGRRNALPDILGSTAGSGAADLPDKLAELSVGGTVCCPASFVSVQLGLLL